MSVAFPHQIYKLQHPTEATPESIPVIVRRQVSLPRLDMGARQSRNKVGRSTSAVYQPPRGSSRTSSVKGGSIPHHDRIITLPSGPTTETRRRRQSELSRSSDSLMLAYQPVIRHVSRADSISTISRQNSDRRKRGLPPVGKVKDYYERRGFVYAPVRNVHRPVYVDRGRGAISMMELRPVMLPQQGNRTPVYATPKPRKRNDSQALSAASSQQTIVPESPPAPRVKKEDRGSQIRTPIFVSTEAQLQSPTTSSNRHSAPPDGFFNAAQDGVTQTPDVAMNNRPKSRYLSGSTPDVPSVQLSQPSRSKVDERRSKEARNAKRKSDKKQRKGSSKQVQSAPPPAPPAPPRPRVSKKTSTEPPRVYQTDTFRRFKRELNEKVKRKEATRHIWEQKLYYAEADGRRRPSESDSVKTTPNSYEQAISKHFNFLNHHEDEPTNVNGFVSANVVSSSDEYSKMNGHGSASGHGSVTTGGAGRGSVLVQNRSPSALDKQQKSNEVHYVVRKSTNRKLELVSNDELKRLQKSGVVIEYEVAPPILVGLWQRKLAGEEIMMRDLNGIRIPSNLIDQFTRDRLFGSTGSSSQGFSPPISTSSASASYSVTESDNEPLAVNGGSPPQFKASLKNDSVRRSRLEALKRDLEGLQKPSFSDGDTKITTYQGGTKFLVNEDRYSPREYFRQQRASSPRRGRTLSTEPQTQIHKYEEGILVRIGYDNDDGAPAKVNGAR